MKHKLKTVILLLLALTGLASAAGPQGIQGWTRTKIAANDPMNLLFIGDSWPHGGSYPGRDMHPALNKPYNLAALKADSTACQGNEYANHVGWRLQTNRVAVLAVGSMPFKLDNDPARTETDSTIYGLCQAEYAELFDPDVVILPGGGGFNDVFGGASYADIRERAILVGKKAIETYSGARWFVWVAPRMCGIYHYERLSGGTNAERQVLAAAEYDLVFKFADFVTDTLKAELATRGVDTSKLVIWDSRPYSTIADEDTAGAYDTFFDSASDAQYAVVRHMRFSPTPWYQADNVHLNDLGNKSYADSLAKHVFGITLDNNYVKGAGRSIYMDVHTGHNFNNRTRCNSPDYPLATLQAAVNQAHPGDVIHVIGGGNQATTAWDSNTGGWVSALDYEIRTMDPGLTIRMENGSYFEGIFNDDELLDIPSGLTEVGKGFLDPYACTAGTDADSLSHDLAATITGQNPLIDLDLTIEGGGISGYNYPLYYFNYSGITLKDLAVAGGASGSSIYPNNEGQVMELNLDGCTVYYDSSTVNTTGQIILNMNVDVTDTECYDGVWRNSQFIGRASQNSSAAITKAACGIDFIGCTWTDPECFSRAFINLDPNNVTYTDYPVTRIIGCRFEGYRSGTLITGVYWAHALDDSVIVVNTDFQLGSTSSSNAIQYPIGPEASGVTIVVGSAFQKVDYPSATRSDLTPSSAESPDYVAGNTLVTPTTLLAEGSDANMFGGVLSWPGGSLEDYAVEHGARHASVGPAVYTAEPQVRIGSQKEGLPAYAQVTLHRLADLVDTGLLPAVDSLDVSTWYRVQAPATEADKAQWQYLLSEYENFPTEVKEKLKLVVED